MKNSKKAVCGCGKHVVEVVGEGEKAVVFVDGVQVEVHDQGKACKGG